MLLCGTVWKGDHEARIDQNLTKVMYLLYKCVQEDTIGRNICEPAGLNLLY